ncbi:TIGR03750 family conjugal transfer protein [Endozoicomonas sp. SM1973]|uniref:TIGR03750 family conjugal transfer protein n=1 Tax=Spartinivicinus marinus TaxID=2994442 RepID=A0A853ICN1_9GAMM|nr:TIGR03750 family conjugal transfer protein [Spartinivicinus marinus]MCX4030181.1 TIGR03750 family conjugal transfer protein [Spartinivicinus marinus]NYZ67824.1 TIGR03750 family conjugal transfer protein [Spartinivicinus marinus]
MSSGEREVGDLVPQRLNEEPLVLKGLCYSEIFMLGGIGIVTGLFVCVPLTYKFLDSAISGIGCSIPFAILFVALFARTLQKVKRNRPVGYLQIKIDVFLQKTGFKRKIFVLEEKTYDTGRRQ